MNVQVRALIDALAARGHDVTAFTRRTCPVGPDVVELSPTSRVRMLAVGPPRPIPKTDLVALIPQFTGALAAHARGVQVWHSHYWLSGAAVDPLARSDGVAHVVNLHTLAPQKDAASPDREPAERYMWEKTLAHSAVLVAGSRFERDLIREHYDADPADVHVVGPGVDTDLFTPALPRPTGLVGEAPYALTVGRVQPHKGQDLAVEAFCALQELWAAGYAGRRPVAPGAAGALRLVIAGEPTPGDEAYWRALRRRVEEAALGRLVRFLPAQDRDAAAGLMAGALVTVVPSHSETYGLVALESAATGTPVLAQDVSGLSESVVDGVTGILLPDRDPLRWGRALADLTADGETRRRLSVGARALALRHTWSDHARGVEAVYRLAVARAGHRP